MLSRDPADLLSPSLPPSSDWQHVREPLLRAANNSGGFLKNVLACASRPVYISNQRVTY